MLQQDHSPKKFTNHYYYKQKNMKVYLKFNSEWKLFDSDKEPDFSKLLKERSIVIGDSAKIGD